jgi:hypothetical protein
MFDLTRLVLSVSLAATLAGCSGSQPPAAAMPQTAALATQIAPLAATGGCTLSCPFDRLGGSAPQPASIAMQAYPGKRWLQKRNARSQAGFVYVSNVLSFSPPYTGAVNYYAVGSNGNVAPSGVISGSNTALTLVNGIAVGNNGEIYVANSDTNSIVGFAPGSNGNASPNSVISGSGTGLASPIGMAIDAAGNIYVSNCGTDCSWGPPGATSVEEFAVGSSGDATPKRIITGSRTKLSGNTNGIAVDRRGFVYVALAGPNAVNVYGPHASGNVAPARVLSGKETHISNPDGVAFGRRGLYITSSYAGRIGLFPRRAAGDASPFSKTRVGWSNKGQQILGGMAAASDDTIYVTGFSVPLVAQYSAGGRSRRSPLAVISGSNTDLVLPTFVFAK